MDLEEKHQVFNAAGEELSAAKQKLMLLDSATEGRIMLPMAYCYMFIDDKVSAVKSKFSAVSIKLDITSNSSDSPLLGVNTPRSDEDRLDIMELTVFLDNNVTRLQALVDRKKVVITEAAIKEESMLKMILLLKEMILLLKEMMIKNYLYHLLHHLLHHHPNLKIFHQHLRRVELLKYDKVAQALEITKLKSRVKKLKKEKKVRVLKLRRLKKVETSQRIDTSKDTVMGDASNQGRIIDDLDKDDVVALMDDKDEDKKEEKAKVVEDDQVQGRRRKGVVIKDPEEESTTIIPADTKCKDKGKGIMVEEPKPFKKKQQVEMDEEYATKLHVELNKDIDCDVAIDHLILLVERRYPLSRFTLDQMLNAMRLQVEEESKMSLELLSFEVDAAMDLEEKHYVFNAAGEELNAAKQKLMLLDSAAKGRIMLLSQIPHKLQENTKFPLSGFGSYPSYEFDFAGMRLQHQHCTCDQNLASHLPRACMMLARAGFPSS
nr:hypothetical protein [Tanacetum cinerariifolium]